MKQLAKKQLAKVMALVMFVLIAASNANVTALAAETSTTTEDYELYLMVDPGETANGFILEPTCITIPAGTDTSRKLGEIICNTLLSRLILVSCTGSYGYISGIRCSEAYNFDVRNYSMYSQMPEAAFHTGIVKPLGYVTRLLSEYNFTGFSGWMFTINNEMSTNVNGSQYYYTMGTTVQELMDMGLLSEEESPVVEMFYTLNMGADVGLCDGFLANQVIHNEDANTYYYNWAGDYTYVTAYEKADRTELVMALADNRYDSDYNSSLAVLKNIQASEESIDTAIYRVSH
ncbi:hypothetical protein [[Clostridium] polysaccharolyticum]|uniref:Uncharacterized protein n=1 Tax=[Clostridium] polysaccharolyticum TaxID=29364 RepID=A0A1I0A8X3_9FIRM|nr:hypothetical protein [[Clostridium] polysaccharolyticum]SES90654.1 hypothetical protein SAMN04487772_10529 [[Clostridium] polysaccharolyticum]